MPSSGIMHVAVHPRTHNCTAHALELIKLAIAGPSLDARAEIAFKSQDEANYGHVAMSSYSSLLSLSPAEYHQVGGHARDVGDDDDVAVAAASLSSYLSCFDMDVVGEYYPPEADFHSAPPPAAAADYKNGDGESMERISLREAGAVRSSSSGLSSHGERRRRATTGDFRGRKAREARSRSRRGQRWTCSTTATGGGSTARRWSRTAQTQGTTTGARARGAA
ncbi:hypothetical protein GUJ93_ZPchr0001g30456 [Zizania palustris]|uniref:Uncharacterized protein n=1 Tax=Zizania palustris TaxID=103762 RepID=A0A8J5UZI6_ZIZPA|nr:hypothetical protein GUJ93_ZPchr0001g30456 [Zizania palustris]